MKKALFTIIAMFFVVLSSVDAQWVQSLNCDNLEEFDFLPQDEFDELAEICFYGSGYSDETVEVSLEGSETTYVLEDVPVTNGILTSLDEGIVESFFSGVTGGIYRLVVGIGTGFIEYGNDIVVHSDSSGDDGNSTGGGDDDTGDDDGDDYGDVPEFSTIAAAAALGGAAWYISMKRSSR